MTYSIHDIADLIITRAKAEDENASLINLKLQKLLYYVQAWSYGIRGEAFFDGEFQAWIHGPVNRAIYDRFSPTKQLYSEIELSDRIRPDFQIEDEKDNGFLNFILENYLQFSGSELETLTHKEFPWIKTREGYGPNQRCEKVIDPQLMKDFYGEKWRKLQAS